MDRRELILVVLIILAVNLGTGFAFLLNPAGGSGVGLTDFPLDDGWIHLVYSRSLATTLRPEYNPGEPESGMTSPLWAVLNALLYRPAGFAGVNPTAAPKFLSMLFGAAAALVLFLLVRWRGAPAPLALGAALLLSMDPQWCFSRVSGMEVTLFAFLLLLCVAGLERGRAGLTGWAMGLAALARPEGLLLAGVIAPLWHLNQPRSRRTPGQWGLLILPLAVLFGGWVAYNLVVTGYPLPNTFYVKGGDAGLLRWGNLSYMVREMVLKAGFLSTVTGTLLYGIGAVHLLRRDPRGNAAVLLLPWVMIYGLSATRVFPLGWPYYWARYFHPVLPFLVFPLAFGLAGIAGFLRKRSAEFLLRPGIAAALTASVFLLVALPGARSFQAYAELYSRNCRDIRLGNVEPGKWLRHNSRPQDWIATIDAGAIRFFSERRTLDVIGLNNHRLAHFADEGFDSKWSALRALAEETRPAYFVLFRNAGQWRDEFDLELVKAYHNADYSITTSVNQGTVLVFRADWD